MPWITGHVDQPSRITWKTEPTSPERSPTGSPGGSICHKGAFDEDEDMVDVGVEEPIKEMEEEEDEEQEYIDIETLDMNTEKQAKVEVKKEAEEAELVAIEEEEGLYAMENARDAAKRKSIWKLLRKDPNSSSDTPAAAQNARIFRVEKSRDDDTKARSTGRNRQEASCSSSNIAAATKEKRISGTKYSRDNSKARSTEGINPDDSGSSSDVPVRCRCGRTAHRAHREDIIVIVANKEDLEESNSCSQDPTSYNFVYVGDMNVPQTALAGLLKHGRRNRPVTSDAEKEKKAKPRATHSDSSISLPAEMYDEDDEEPANDGTTRRMGPHSPEVYMSNAEEEGEEYMDIDDDDFSGHGERFILANVGPRRRLVKGANTEFPKEQVCIVQPWNPTEPEAEEQAEGPMQVEGNRENAPENAEEHSGGVENNSQEENAEAEAVAQPAEEASAGEGNAQNSRPEEAMEDANPQPEGGANQEAVASAGGLVENNIVLGSDPENGYSSGGESHEITYDGPPIYVLSLRPVQDYEVTPDGHYIFNMRTRFYVYLTRYGAFEDEPFFAAEGNGYYVFLREGRGPGDNNRIIVRRADEPPRPVQTHLSVPVEPTTQPQEQQLIAEEVVDRKERSEIRWALVRLRDDPEGLNHWMREDELNRPDLIAEYEERKQAEEAEQKEEVVQERRPERVVDAFRHGEELMLVMKWVNQESYSVVSAREANENFPHLVIAFYESRVRSRFTGLGSSVDSMPIIPLYL